MNRAERRRQRKTEKRRTATYNLTSGQLQSMVKQESDKLISDAYEDGFSDGINKALVLMWCLPLLVLREHFWQKSFPTRAKRFCDELFELYSRWQDDELDITEIQNQLWEVGGIRLQEGESQ